MILGLEGNTSAGKSSLLYSGPLPLVSLAWDSGVARALEGSRWKEFEGIDIQVVHYPPLAAILEDPLALKKFWMRNNGKAITAYLLPQELQTSKVLTGNRSLWNTAVKIFNLAIAMAEIKTVGVDTMTIGRRVAADAYLEQLQNGTGPFRSNLIEVEWGKPGDYIRSQYTTAQNQVEAFQSLGIQKHLIVTHHRRPRRMNRMDSQGVVHSEILYNSKNEELQEMEGLSNTYRFLDVNLLMEKELGEVEDILGNKSKQTVIKSTFIKCGYDISLEGTSLQNVTWNSLVTHLNKNISPKAQIELRQPLK